MVQPLPGDPILFSAARAPSSAWYATGFAAILLLPLLLLAPDAYFIGVAVSLVLAGLNQSTFRFEITATHLRLKSSFFLPAIFVPLIGIAKVAHRPLLSGLRGGPGVLVLETTGGGRLIVAGIADAPEAAHALLVLRDHRLNVHRPSRLAAIG
jgi:hypothetical protein